MGPKRDYLSPINHSWQKIALRLSISLTRSNKAPENWPTRREQPGRSDDGIRLECRFGGHRGGTHPVTFVTAVSSVVANVNADMR